MLQEVSGHTMQTGYYTRGDILLVSVNEYLGFYAFFDSSARLLWCWNEDQGVTGSYSTCCTIGKPSNWQSN